jgi:hypothetical protein
LHRRLEDVEDLPLQRHGPEPKLRGLDVLARARRQALAGFYDVNEQLGDLSRRHKKG